MTSNATQSGPKRLVIASGNRGKLAEFERLLTGSGIACVTQAELGVDDIEETGLSFVENALLKARHAARVTGLPALADDSGLCVDALDGAPGLYSARYSRMHGGGDDALSRADRDAANVDKLLDVLRDVPDEARGAHFIAVIVALRHADDPQPVIAEGIWRGRVLHARQGNGGFGYDPVFYDPDNGMSAAEIEPGLKSRISHRGRAMASLRQRLGELL